MVRTYPQETLGTTLLDVTHNNEKRRVYMRSRAGYLEVGEFTRGHLSQVAYEWPVHLHCIHLPADYSPDDLRRYFSLDEPYLADLMDDLDSKHVSYGYLNSVANRYVSFRPARQGLRSVP